MNNTIKNLLASTSSKLPSSVDKRSSYEFVRRKLGKLDVK